MKNVSLLCIQILERGSVLLMHLKESSQKLSCSNALMLILPPRETTTTQPVLNSHLIATPIPRRRDKSSLPSNVTMSYSCIACHVHESAANSFSTMKIHTNLFKTDIRWTDIHPGCQLQWFTQDQNTIYIILINMYQLLSFSFCWATTLFHKAWWCC